MWLPARVVPEGAVRAGIGAISRALLAGGWLMLGPGTFTGDPLDDAITRFKTMAYGGTALDDGEAVSCSGPPGPATCGRCQLRPEPRLSR